VNTVIHENPVEDARKDIGEPEQSDGESSETDSDTSDSSTDEDAQSPIAVRKVWRVDFGDSPDIADSKTTLGQALKGIAILEWPEIEVWPRELVESDIRDGRLELTERRGQHQQSRDVRDSGWGGRKRKADEVPLNEHVEDMESEQRGGDAEDDEDIDGAAY